MSARQTFSQTIPNDLAAAERIQERIIGLLESFHYPPRDVFGVRLALEEAIVNAIKHGNGMDPDKSLQIEVDVDEQRALVHVQDEGRGFDPDDVPDPTAEENLERPGGRGIMLMRAFMTSVEYNRRGNRVSLVKQRGDDAETDEVSSSDAGAPSA